jgi:hypothetical protein
MKLEQYLDQMLRKDTMDVVILDTQGKDISNILPGKNYAFCEVTDVSYQLIALIKVQQ